MIPCGNIRLGRLELVRVWSAITLVAVVCILPLFAQGQAATPGQGSVTLQTTSSTGDCTISDYTMHLVVNGTDYMKAVGCDVIDGTVDKVAAEWASEINAGTLVSATSSGNTTKATISLTSKSAGANTNYSLSASGDCGTCWYTLTPSGPALTGGADAAITATMNPKYVVLSILYAPPGSQSTVDYSGTTIAGSSTSISNSLSSTVSESVTIKASGGIFGTGSLSATKSSSFSDEKDSSSSIELTSSTTSDFLVRGPANDQDGINHNFDTFVIWLNPVANFAQVPSSNVLTWSDYTFDAADPAHEMDIQFVTVEQLQNPSLIPNGVASAFLRSWAPALADGSGPALTTTDYAQILALDPFTNSSYVVTLGADNTTTDNRFTLTGGTTFPYDPPGPGGQPGTSNFKIQKMQTTKEGLSAKTTNMVGFSLSNSSGGSIPGIVDFTVTVQNSKQFQWTSQASQDSSQGVGQSASFSLTGPGLGYQGCTDIQAFQDNVYGTFMFNCVTEPTYNMTVMPATATIPVGSQTQYTVSVSPVNSFNGTVKLSTGSLPTGVSASFNPTSITGSGTSTLTVTTDPSTTTAQNINITVGGDSSTPTVAGIRRNVTVALVAQDFSVAVSPNPQNVIIGGTATYTVTTAGLAGLGFAGNITLSAGAGLPSGATVTFTPNPIAGVGSSSLKVTVPSSAAPGNYQFNVIGTDGNLSHSTPVTLTVLTPDFTISATPSSASVLPGGCTNYTVSTTAVNRFTGTVSLSQNGAPSGSSAVFTPNSINGAGSSTLRVCTTSSTPAGSYTIDITGISGSSHSVSVALVVQDFTLSATPASQTVTAGGSTSYNVSASAVNGFSGSISLSASGLPSGASASFSPASFSGSGTSTLTVTTTSSTPAGTYTVTISGSSPISDPSGSNRTVSTTVTLVVNPAPDFSLSANPTSLTVDCGCVTDTITVTPIGGFNGVVNITVSGLPSGATASVSSASVTGSGSVTISICTTSTTAAGNYTITITGTSGSLTHSVTVTLVVTDFSLSATPSSQTVNPGGSTSYTLSTTAINGFNGNANLSVTGLPTGASASFSPASITGAGSSTMAVTTSSSTPAGTYTLTITATDGCRSHSVTVTLVVNVPDFSLSATPSSQTVFSGSNTTYTASTAALGGFGGNVALSLGRLPTGATGSFSPTSISGAGSSTLTINTSSSTPAGTYNITVTGTSGSLTHSVTVTLIVTVPAPDFGLSATPSSQTISAGSNTTYTLSASAIGGFNGSVALSLGRLPTGATGSFNPTSISGAGSSTLTITTSSSTPVGTYNIAVTGTSGSLTHSVTGALVVTVPTTVVTFDNPVPPGNPFDPLNGVFQGINFGTTGAWAWEGAYANDNTNNIFFNSGTATSETFSFASGTHILVSMKSTTTVAGTLTLTDDTGQTVSQTVPTGTLLTITTGWTKPSTTITVNFTAGWNVALDDITYQ